MCGRRMNRPIEQREADRCSPVQRNIVVENGDYQASERLSETQR